jgi:hypothetical protein
MAVPPTAEPPVADPPVAEPPVTDTPVVEVWDWAAVAIIAQQKAPTRPARKTVAAVVEFIVQTRNPAARAKSRG